MPDQVKVTVVEVNGTELDFATELLLVPENIPFSDPGFLATDLKAAVIEARTFSIRYITSGIVVIIPFEQQMILYQLLDIVDGELDLIGEVVIL